MIVTLKEITDRAGLNKRQIDAEMHRLSFQVRQDHEDLIVHLPEDQMHEGKYPPYTHGLLLFADQVWVVDQDGNRKKCIKSRNLQELST